MNPAYVAFEGEHRIGAGDLPEVARAAKQHLDQRKDAAILVFNGRTSALVDIDFRGSVDDVLGRLPKLAPLPDGEPAAPTAPRGPGRPKLGVVAREITLLPRHWDWLAQQKGGASVAIRKLIDEARRSSGDKDRTRSAQDAAYRFMTVMAGNRPNYEDAIRALFAHDRRRFATLIADWPADIRDHAIRLAYSDQAD
ncbi:MULTISPECIES: DUF2239 family protein [Bradyrhizobium]|jgi:uncharacterized protein|uniref:DUF2239 family protein n=1 Tax=Bradyrhizobium TaxID=374 RepID=UPI0004888FF2|nr:MULTISPECIES: DUF2239 family protein [Bradyrhizobium]MCS3444898.1 hypothetical protein [Bradyrhizobium elkanii]MCS3563974.1 hypothetical protein [Bradyrhizobium elkanii]MCW2146194.1 hypothetical protein [Bradyrhizobium elkanii]MCW2354733.1 hypothetical protein [Bradyrhizobium elkanii]MCW2379021.1 hypothetical protein [Bradyrhizobium elkanii]